MRWKLDENNGDIIYEAVGDLLILKIRPSVINALQTPIVINENKGNGADGYWKLTENGLSIYTDYPAFSKGDIVAFAENTEISNIPVGTTSSLGILGVKDGGGISIENGYIYLTNNSSGTEPTKITILTSTDTTTAASDDNVFSALRTLAEIQKAVNSQYWNQIEDYIFTTYEARSQKDFIAYATSDGTSSIPIASNTSVGIVGILSGGGLTIDANGYISISSDYQGGTTFTAGTALQLTSANVLNVVFGTTSTTACVGNDSRLSDKRICPYVLKFSGYSVQSYDGTSAITVPIPSKVTDLSDASNYVTGTSLSSTLTGYVTLTTSQTISGAKTFSTTLIDTADVVAYYTGSYTSAIPVATSSSYGLVKYDGSTIQKNSSGQLYAATQSIDLSNYADLSSNQTIGGTKTFSKAININNTWAELVLRNTSTSNYIELINDNSLSGDSSLGSPAYCLSFWLNGNRKALITPTGLMWIASTLQQNSDERLKNITGRETNILDKVSSIHPIYYNMKDDERKKISLGLSAQEIQKHLPCYVEEINGYLTLNYSQLGAVVAIEGCNELNNKIKEMQKTIDSLQQQIKTLRA